MKFLKINLCTCKNLKQKRKNIEIFVEWHFTGVHNPGFVTPIFVVKQPTLIIN